MLIKMGQIAGVIISIAVVIFVLSYMFYAFWQHLAANITN